MSSSLGSFRINFQTPQGERAKRRPRIVNLTGGEATVGIQYLVGRELTQNVKHGNSRPLQALLGETTSRIHAKIQISSQGNLKVQDCKSTNGTWLFEPDTKKWEPITKEGSENWSRWLPGQVLLFGRRDQENYETATYETISGSNAEERLPAQSLARGTKRPLEQEHEEAGSAAIAGSAGSRAVQARRVPSPPADRQQAGQASALASAPASASASAGTRPRRDASPVGRRSVVGPSPAPATSSAFGRANIQSQCAGRAPASRTIVGLATSSSSTAPSACGAKKKKCDKCDGPHETDGCPHFKKGRDDHKDAWANYGKTHPGNMGATGGNFVLRHAYVKKQPGDGSCLFHSLSDGGQLGVNGYQLRKELASFIARNPRLEIAGDTIEEWVRWDCNATCIAYANRMAVQGWGGGIEMAACALLKKVNVHVYEHNRGSQGFKRISCFDNPQAKKTVHVLYQGGVHYDALKVQRA